MCTNFRGFNFCGCRLPTKLVPNENFCVYSINSVLGINTYFKWSLINFSKRIRTKLQIYYSKSVHVPKLEASLCKSAFVATKAFIPLPSCPLGELVFTLYEETRASKQQPCRSKLYCMCARDWFGLQGNPLAEISSNLIQLSEAVRKYKFPPNFRWTCST